MEKLKKKPNDGLTSIFPLEYRADDSSDRAAVVATVGEGRASFLRGERGAFRGEGPRWRLGRNDSEARRVDPRGPQCGPRGTRRENSFCVGDAPRGSRGWTRSTIRTQRSR